MALTDAAPRHTHLDLHRPDGRLAGVAVRGRPVRRRGERCVSSLGDAVCSGRRRGGGADHDGSARWLRRMDPCLNRLRRGTARRLLPYYVLLCRIRSRSRHALRRRATSSIIGLPRPDDVEHCARPCRYSPEMSRRNATPKLATPPPGVIAGRDAMTVLPGISSADLDLIEDALSRSVRNAPARRIVRSRKPRPVPGRTPARGRARRPGGSAAGPG